MALLSLITAWTPSLPFKAETGLTLRSLPSVTVDDQAEKLPDSNPSEKIGSMIGVGVNVGVSEGPSVAVCVGVAEAVGVSDGVLVGVNDGALVDVNEATGEKVRLTVGVKLEAAVGVRVGVLVKVPEESVFVATGVEVGEFVVTMS